MIAPVRPHPALKLQTNPYNLGLIFITNNKHLPVSLEQKLSCHKNLYLYLNIYNQDFKPLL